MSVFSIIPRAGPGGIGPSTRVGGRQGVGMAGAFHQELEYSFGGIPRQVMEVLLRNGRLAEEVEQLLHGKDGIK